MGSNSEFECYSLEKKLKLMERLTEELERLTEEQAFELQKRQTTIDNLVEQIEYALFCRELDYGMSDNYIHFTMRKVFSILEEALEGIKKNEDI